MYSLNINNSKTIDNLEIYMLNSIKNISVEIVKDEIKELKKETLENIYFKDKQESFNECGI